MYAFYVEFLERRNSRFSKYRFSITRFTQNFNDIYIKRGGIHVHITNIITRCLWNTNRIS